MNKLLLFVNLFFISHSSFSNVSDVRMKDDNSLSFYYAVGEGFISLKLDIDINGYTSNCDRTKIVVWGREKSIDDYNIPPGYYYVYNMNSLKLVGEKKSADVYDVIFINDNKAYVGTQSGTIVDVNTGSVELPNEEDFDFVSENKIQQCSRPILHYNRYPSD